MEHFKKFGEISEVHIVLDKETKRSKGIAYILYQIPESAARAMETLDNKVFQGRFLRVLPAKHRKTSDKGEPQYLEWAPGDILEPKAILDDKEKKSDVGEINDVRRVNLEHTFEIDSDITESNVLHVKNLSFKTSDESLKKHLSELVLKQGGKILSVNIVTREKNGRNLSSGYGFVAFDSIETATSVYRDGQGTVVDGHALIFRFSENKKRSDRLGKGSDKDKNLKKLHVKNVPFEATVKELRRLISPFAKIKSLRIPKKNTGKHAGYAFIEFMTNQEALNAQRKLSNTPIYRRKLVFEWAKDDDSMEANRARSAAKYMAAQGNIHPKKRKSSTLVAERRIKFQRNC